jgi:hypothetical protein
MLLFQFRTKPARAEQGELEQEAAKTLLGLALTVSNDLHAHNAAPAAVEALSRLSAKNVQKVNFNKDSISATLLSPGGKPENLAANFKGDETTIYYSNPNTKFSATITHVNGSLVIST